MLFLVAVNVGKETIPAFESYNFIVVHQIKQLKSCKSTFSSPFWKRPQLPFLGFLTFSKITLQTLVFSMEQKVINELQHLCLTKEEEEEIPVSTQIREDLLEECSLSLFGKLLSERQQNIRALKSTLKAAWKMGSELRIVEVGSNILQLKFGSSY